MARPVWRPRASALDGRRWCRRQNPRQPTDDRQPSVGCSRPALVQPRHQCRRWVWRPTPFGWCPRPHRPRLGLSGRRRRRGTGMHQQPRGAGACPVVAMVRKGRLRVHGGKDLSEWLQRRPHHRELLALPLPVLASPRGL